MEDLNSAAKKAGKLNNIRLLTRVAAMTVVIRLERKACNGMEVALSR